jgi:hypothetical protein
MKARRILWAGLVLLVVVGIAGALLHHSLASPPSHNYHRVHPGTSRVEVYKLFGGPGWRPHCGVGIPPGEDPEFWETPQGTVRVDFDFDGNVIRAQGPSLSAG